MLREFHIFLGHFPGHPGCFFGFSRHPWDMYCILTCGWPMLFQIFSHQIMCVHPADALKIPDFPGTFTQTWGCFFWVLVHPEYAPEIPHFPGTFTQTHFPGTFTLTQGFFLSGFPHTTSSRCSGFSWDIYPDTGVVFFGYAAHYIIQLLQLFLEHLHGRGSCFFQVFHTLHHPDAPVSLGTFTWTWWVFFSGLSTHYIRQMLWFCLGHLPGHGSWFFRDFHTLHHPDAPAFLGTFTQTWGLFFFRVFRTLHHADAPDFLGTFTQTQGLFFSGFMDTTSCRCSGFSYNIYLDTVGCFFSGFCTSCRCSGNSARSWAIYPDRGCYFWAFHTLHRADAPDFLGTFTWTPGLFFWGFPHSTETCTSFLPACDIFV